MKALVNIHSRLSTKANKSGYREILLIVRNHDVKSYGHSGIMVDARYFIEGVNDTRTMNRPFEGVKIGSEQAGTPQRYRKIEDETLMNVIEFLK